MISLVCPGGGARGALQVGMLKAWSELGIKADMVYGTSVGAINGMMFHQDQGKVDNLEECWAQMKGSDVFNINTLHWMNPLTRKDGLLSSAPLKKTIARYLDYGKVKANPTPFYVTTTNMTTWKPYTLNVRDLGTKDEMVNFILASASLPVAFSPVRWGPYQLADGGLVGQFNINDSIRNGVDTIVVLRPVLPKTNTKVNNLIDAFSLTTSIPEEYVMDRELTTVEFINKIQESTPLAKHINVVVVQPTLPPAWDILDFTFGGKKPKDIIKAGYELAYPLLEKAFK